MDLLSFYVIRWQKGLNKMVFTKKHKLIMICLAGLLFFGFTVYEKHISKKQVYVLSEASMDATLPMDQISRTKDSLSADDTDVYEEQAGAETINWIMVHIEGEVHAPGVYELEEGTRLNDLVLLAGGLTPEADRKINLAQKLQDEAFVYIPSIEESSSESDAASISVQTPAITFQSNTLEETSSLVNINTGNQSQLESLPGIGPVLAERIIHYRESKGLFQRLDDLKNVSGIGDKRYEDLEDHITL